MPFLLPNQQRQSTEGRGARTVNEWNMLSEEITITGDSLNMKT